MLNVIYFSFAWFEQPAAAIEGGATFMQQGLQLQIVGEKKVSDKNEQSLRRSSYCLAIGPWAEGADADRSQLLNQEFGLNGKIERLSLRKNQLHWVYMPAMESRRAASDMLKELHFNGVDSFIVTEGEDENAVSLGYFSSKESAVGLRAKMVNAGYEAEIRETWKDVVEYWLVFSVAPYEIKKSETIYSSAEAEGLTVMQVACDN